MSKQDEPIELPEVIDVAAEDIDGYQLVHQPIGQVSIFRSMDPAEQLAEAQARARVLIDVVKEQKLSKSFKSKSGQMSKPHLFVEAWQFLASGFGLMPEIEWTKELEGRGWEARAVLRRLGDGQVVSAAEGECRYSEENWKGRPSYAVRSMAQTRAVSKVCRVALAPVVILAGFAATPAEEMDGITNPYGDGEPTPARPKPNPATEKMCCPACLDQLGTIVAVTGPHDRKPFWRCTADPTDCGGHRVYQDKDYSWSGWRTSFENSVAEYRGEVIKDDPQTSLIDTARTQRSGYIVHEIMQLVGLVSRVDAEVLVKPGLVYAIDQKTVDAKTALGAKPGNPISDDELRIIIANLTLAEADAVVAAAASLAPDLTTEET